MKTYKTDLCGEFLFGNGFYCIEYNPELNLFIERIEDTIGPPCRYIISDTKVREIWFTQYKNSDMAHNSIENVEKVLKKSLYQYSLFDDFNS